MAKKKTKRKTVLLQTNVQPELERRFQASPEFKLHGNISTALRAILDRVLPQVADSKK